MKVRVLIVPRQDLGDPQSGVLFRTLVDPLGMNGIQKVVVGRLVELTFVEGIPRDQVLEQIQMMCDTLLCNPVMEDATVEFVDE